MEYEFLISNELKYLLDNTIKVNTNLELPNIDNAIPDENIAFLTRLMFINLAKANKIKNYYEKLSFIKDDTFIEYYSVVREMQLKDCYCYSIE